MSGSIAAYRVCDLIRGLRAEGANVVCLMTRAAQEFITPLTLKSLSGNQVYTDPFSGHEDWNVVHTTLADQANLILVAPATADVIARMAAGMADDMVTSVILASQAPVLVVPAMNDHMYAHSITQENIKKLSKHNYQFVNPIEGDLVCGRKGMGHIADNSQMLVSIHKILNAKN